MSKKAKGGSGNLLLLAGLGVGAFMLFANKSNAQSNSSANELAPGSETDIPDAPKILAVNSSNTESPLPTGIVSDEEGMEVTSSGGASTSVSSSGSGGANPSSIEMDAETEKEYNEIPPLVSTTLTPKEKAIINSGKLTTALALKRPDLYKATYIQKYGGKTENGKKKGLQQANKAIATAVAAANAAKTGGLKKAHAYPAKPQHTFVQSSGGTMVSQTTVTKAAAIQKAGTKRTTVHHKPVVKAHGVKSSKGRHPVKQAASHPIAKKAAAHPHGRKKIVAKRLHH